MKGLACICVVLLHCALPHRIGDLICGQCRFAVPFFFAIAGYYLYSEDYEEVKARRQRGIRRTWVYLVRTEIIYLVWHLIYASLSSKSVNGAIEWIAETFTPYNLFRFVVFQRTFIGDVSWFLVALLLCYCAVGVIARHRLWCLAFLSIPILYAINIYIGDVVALSGIKIEWYWLSNLYLLGFPSFMLGGWIRANEYRLEKLSVKMWMEILLGSCILNLLERTLTMELEFHITSVLVVIALMMLCIKNPDPGREMCWILMRHVGKYLSFTVYIFHPIVRDIIRLLANNAGIEEKGLYRIALPVLTVTGTLLCSEMIWRCKNRIVVRRQKDIV